jgi:hypothetical protein
MIDQTKIITERMTFVAPADSIPPADVCKMNVDCIDLSARDARQVNHGNENYLPALFPNHDSARQETASR